MHSRCIDRARRLGERILNLPAANPEPGDGAAASYWKVIRSVRVSVTACGFKGWFTRFALPEFKTL
jgi:hypothetical protein